MLLAALAAVYLLLGEVLPGRVDGSLLAYVIRPLAWLAIGGVALLLERRTPGAHVHGDNDVVTFGLALGVLHVLLLIAAGALAGFGRSPHLFSLRGIATNVFLFGSTLLGIELARGYMVGSLAKKRFATTLVSSAIVLSLAQIPFGALSGLDSATGAVMFSGTRLLPDVAEGLLASLLVFLGGVPASLAYRGSLEVFRWLSPILPDLPWALAALTGTLAPLAGMLWLGSRHRDRLPGLDETPAESRPSTLWWVGFGLFTLLVVWVSSGILGPQPLLVASRSMSPALQLGDVVVVREVPPETIQEGDVIAFAGEIGTIIHRVVEVTGTAESASFVTQGDANDEPDRDLVLASNVRGKVVLKIPKIGWVSIGARNALAALF